MRRYAFIDVHNTKGSAAILGFSVDPQKLFEYLAQEKWSCESVFWYSGRIQNKKHEKERAAIAEVGFVIRDKLTFFHTKQPRTYKVECPQCKSAFDHTVQSHGLPKANCDVELSVDCLELVEPNAEFLIFTGDGDFRYLIEKLLEKGVKVTLVSTRKRDMRGDYRFSSRYSDLLKSNKITFLELDNLKYRIQKGSYNAPDTKKPPRSATVPIDKDSV